MGALPAPPRPREDDGRQLADAAPPAPERSSAERGRQTAVACLLAERYAVHGQLDEALEQIEGALAAARETGERCWEEELHRIRGQVRLFAGARGGEVERGQRQADECFPEALAVAHCQGSGSLALRAAADLSRLWQSQGRGDEARSLLAEVRGAFSEGFDTPDLKEAGALLETLGNRA